MTYVTNLKTDSSSDEIAKWLTSQGHPATEGSVKAVRIVLADKAEREQARRKRLIMLSREERRRVLDEIEAEELARDKRVREELDDFAWALLAVQIGLRLERRATNGLTATPAAHWQHRALLRYIACKVPGCDLPEEGLIRDAKRPLVMHLLDEHKILANGVTPERAELIFKQLLHDDSIGFLCRLRAEGMRGAVEILYPEDDNDEAYIQQRRAATPSYSQVLRDKNDQPVRDEKLTRDFLRTNAELRLRTLTHLEIINPEISKFSPNTPPLGLLPVRHKVAVDVDPDDLPPVAPAPEHAETAPHEFAPVGI